ALFKEHVGIGLMRGLRVVSADVLANIINACRKEGVMVLRAGRNTLRFLPPLTITKDEIDEGFKRFNNALASL
ncbi:MAG TPA: aminotransferase class III-fold pyridoxal phosphate-dependent enzyme, partial [Helicobacteraceae bacterium]|nr:aminotransferase class III-fold pyridoxal phosphate-dependent enzyme [Helicobacteraceae bacterium]